MMIYTLIFIALTLVILVKHFDWLKQDIQQLVQVSLHEKNKKIDKDIQFIDEAAHILQEKIQFYEHQLQVAERAIYERKNLLQTMDLMIQDKRQELEQLENLGITPQLAVQTYNERKELK